MTAISSLSAAQPQPAAKSAEREELAKAAKAFEAIFVRNLIGSMRESGFGDDLTGSSAVKQFQEMSDATTADSLAETGGLGIAEMLLQQFDQRSAASTPAASGIATDVGRLVRK